MLIEVDTDGCWERDRWSTLILATVAGELGLGLRLSRFAAQDGMRGGAASAAHMLELAGPTGATHGFIKVVAGWTKAPGWAPGGVSNGAVRMTVVGAGTQETVRLSLTRQGDRP